MNVTALRDRTRLLHAELRWLMRLRWVAGGAVLTGSLLQWAHGGDNPQPWQIAALGACILAANTGFWSVLPHLPKLRSRYGSLLVFASAQIYFDLACITLLACWTGGLASPVLGLYVLHMVFASLLQPRALAYTAAGVAIAMLAIALEIAGHAHPDHDSVLVGIGWAVTMVAIVYLADRITGALYRREFARYRQIQRTRELSSRLRRQQQAMIQHEKMVALGRLAAGVAHEIGNPLAAIDGVLQLMQRHGGAPRPESVNSMREQVARISRIVRGMTAFAHPGQKLLEMGSVNDVVRSAVSLLAFDSRLRNTRVECTLADGLPLIPLDAHSLQQVLMNLIINALDATSGKPDARVELRTHATSSGVAIDVRDNGCGIEPEHLEEIFEPFFTTKPVGQGTGLGLSISASLVRELGGRIDVASQPGRGTLFTVRLPVSTPSDEPQPGRQPARALAV